MVAALKPRAARYAVPDPELRGGWIRVQPSGSKTYWTVTRNPNGKQVLTLAGNVESGLAVLRESARSMLQRVRGGLPAFEPKAETFATVAANWLTRHVESKGLRSRYQIERLLTVHILPVWKDREFTSIRRGDIATLLDTVEDDHGARQAEYCLAVIRAIAKYATRNEDYNSPVVRGMRRINPKERARKRVLTDVEFPSPPERLSSQQERELWEQLILSRRSRLVCGSRGNTGILRCDDSAGSLP